jgi:2-dehydro-3-deoxyphosphogalactonate aldolase
MAVTLRDALSDVPLIAMLRGIDRRDAADIAEVIVGAGIQAIEVALNSTHPLSSIEAIAAKVGSRALIGAGTVIDPSDAARVRDAGGRLVVAPHTSAAVLEASHRAGMETISGVMTPSEAFAALAHRATALKLFPAQAIPPSALAAMRSVLPTGALLLPVGGITAANLGSYRQAGADGFGIGMALYRPQQDLRETRRRADRLVGVLRSVTSAGAGDPEPLRRM